MKLILYPLEKLLTAVFSLKGFLLIFLILLAFFANIVFVTQPLKIKSLLSSLYKKSSRQTLSRVDGHLAVEGPLNSSGMDIRVLKIKQADKIFLEFLSKRENNSYWLINSIELEGSREAYFDYWGEPSSLLLLDENGDGFLEVMAPAFDQFFKPRINLASYNKDTQKFELIKKTNSQPRVIVPEERY